MRALKLLGRNDAMVPLEIVTDADEGVRVAEVGPSERPTIPAPAPRASGLRLGVTRIRCASAVVDVVVCDLARDPRSEDYQAERAESRAPSRPRAPLFDWDTLTFNEDAWSEWEEDVPPSSSGIRLK